MGNFGEDISPKPTTWIVARCTVIRLALMNRLCQKNDHHCVGPQIANLIKSSKDFRRF